MEFIDSLMYWLSFVILLGGTVVIALAIIVLWRLNSLLSHWQNIRHNITEAVVKAAPFMVSLVTLGEGVKAVIDSMQDDKKRSKKE